MREAYEISSATNNFPEICGRICPQDRLCEGNCVIEKGFGSVTIGSVEKTITETAFAEGWVQPFTPSHETGRSVGIIGAGPAGLAAAEMLRRHGHAVTVYDRYDRVGGLMIYGIPNFKLDKSIVARREQLLRDSGIQFRLNTTIGPDLSFDELRSAHDAVLIATGVYGARALGISLSDAPNVLPALDYLTANNKRCLGDMIADQYITKGNHVVVIGGGDTAMDCVRTAIRQEAASITCLYRRDRANMPGSLREVKNAEDEGVRFEWLSAPAAFHIENGRVHAVEVQRMQLNPADASGRQSVAPITGDTYRMPTDVIIQALGFEAEDLSTLWNTPTLKRTTYGTVAIDAKRFETSIPGVFAAGDIVRGASLVVWAIKDGRDAAAAMHRHLTAQKAQAA
ncbi:MAG: dihydropyrimidine dehydrogenase, partial [Rhodospirillales bacterium 12-54-5]